MRRLSRPVLVAHCSLGANSPISPPQRITYFVIRTSFLVTRHCLLLPACGGGGDAAGDNYVSPLQFANGSKGFLIPSTPDLFVFTTGGGASDIEGSLEETFMAGINDADTTGWKWDAPDFGEGAESVFTQNGLMRLPEVPLIPCTVYYAVTGGPGGKGCMLIHPQSQELSQSNSSAATALINFLGGITPDQAGQDQAANTPDSQYVIQSIAATTLRITFDFAAGTSMTDAIMMINVAKDDKTEAKPVAKLRIGPKAFFARPV